jgi:hypothetical protein
MEFSQTIAGYIAGEDEQPRVCASISLMRFAELAVPTIPGFTAKAGTEQEVADGEIVGISLGKAMGAYEPPERQRGFPLREETGFHLGARGCHRPGRDSNPQNSGTCCRSLLYQAAAKPRG